MENNRLGQVLGIWRLGQLIGCGGMGDVYRAQRVDGVVDQEAAVKILRSNAPAGLTDEAATLRSIRHPNIVRYLDSGVTSDGHRYLVMEYVDGSPITDYADQMGLSIWQRLGLFIKACDAVAWAHLYLLLHLDLKPGNILVGKDNIVKVVDFGIARRLNASDHQQGFDAHSGPYSSPEQIHAGRIGCAADIYGLGATLYELLSGHEPFNPYVGTGELERQIADKIPPPPSDAINQPKLHLIEPGKYSRLEPERLAAMRGGRGVPEVRKLLHGDLDRICRYALRKEPTRRFKTVDDFRSDVGRVLKRLPPEFAHSDGLGYLAWRTAQQQPLVVAAVVFAIAATYSAHIVSDSQFANQRVNAAATLQVDRVSESSVNELTEQLRPKLTSAPRLRRSLEAVDAERKALAVRPKRTGAQEIQRDGDGILRWIRRIIPGDAMSRMP